MSIKIRVDASGLRFNLADTKIKANCPECKAVNMVTLEQVQRQESVSCVGCSKPIKLVDKDQSASKAISNVNNAFGDLRRALEDLGC